VTRRSRIEIKLLHFGVGSFSGNFLDRLVFCFILDLDWNIRHEVAEVHLAAAGGSSVRHGFAGAWLAVGERSKAKRRGDG